MVAWILREKFKTHSSCWDSKPLPIDSGPFSDPLAHAVTIYKNWSSRKTLGKNNSKLFLHLFPKMVYINHFVEKLSGGQFFGKND